VEAAATAALPGRTINIRLCFIDIILGRILPQSNGWKTFKMIRQMLSANPF
jgi:hypothetical protein